MVYICTYFICALSMLSVGWNHCVTGDRLSLYQLTQTEAGPVIGLSLMIKADYSWVVRHKNDVVSHENCLLLRNSPAFINSGKF